MRPLHIISKATLLAVLCVAPQAMAQTPLPGVTRIDLLRRDLSAPGREIIQARINLAPETSAPRHSHPGEELVYVIEGAIEYQLDGQPPVTLNVGEVLFIPAGAVHAARSVGAGPAAELATYIVEKGEPLIVSTK